jgi:tetratricopeptide (TPR) repeat protein
MDPGPEGLPPLAGEGLPGLLVPAPRPLTLAPADRERRLTAAVDSLVRHAMALPPAGRRPAAARADSLAAVLLAFRPDAADAHHWRAVTAGLLAEASGKAERIRLGRLAYERATTAVELDPAHAGAHHVLGRVHLGLLRLSWIARFFAGRMGLGPLLDTASWDVAEHHLRRAAELAPREPSFHLELGTLLAERGRPEEARPHLRRVLELSAPRGLEGDLRERARRLLEGLGGDDRGNS